MLKRVILAAISVVLAVYALSAQTYTISAAPTPYTILYTGSTPGTTSGSFTVTFTGLTISNPVSDISPVATSRTNAAWTKVGGGTPINLSYNIYKDLSYTTVLNKLVKNQGTTELVIHPYTTAFSQTVNYYVRVPAATPPPAGIYETVITIGSYQAGYSGSGTIPALTTSANVTLSLVVGATQTITISPASINYGIVTSKPADTNFTVNVTSNYRYNLLVSSANGGALKNGANSVGYLLTMGAVPSTMVAGQTYPVALNQAYNNYTGGGAPTPFTGTISFPVFDAYIAGTYLDTLTFTISSQ